MHPSYLGFQLDVQTKPCTKCKVDKPLEEYYNHKKGKFGKQPRCKSCLNEQVRDWAKSNKDKTKSYVQTWRKNNKERYNTTHAEWSSRNRHKRNHKEGLRRASKVQATPSWLSAAQKQEILYHYSLAKEAELITGDKYHVDHVIPLINEDICGLHVPWNLQVLPSDVNLKKSNTFTQEGC